MFFNNFFCSNFSSSFKRNFFIRPRSFYHSRFVLFAVTDCTVYNIAYAVNHSHIEGCVATEIDFNGFLGNKFGFCGHYGSSCRRLRKFVNGTPVNCLVTDIWQDKRIHKSFYRHRRRFFGKYPDKHFSLPFFIPPYILGINSILGASST